MTIALGILASDAVVIAADSEITYGNVMKADGGKLRGAIHIGKDGGRLFVLAGAGTGPTIDAFASDLQGVLGDPRLSSGADPRVVMQPILEAFFARHVIPFASFPVDERPDFNAVIGFTTAGRSYLFESSWNTLVSVQDERYTAVGVGSLAARSFLGRMLAHHGSVSVREAVVLASYAVLLAKDTVPGCGKRTDLLVLQAGGVSRLTPNEQNKLDEWLRRYNSQFEPEIFRVVSGAHTATRIAGMVDELKAGVDEAVPLRRFTRPSGDQPAPESQPVRPRPTRGRKSRPPSPE
jgi:hypothetical protein